MIGRSGRVLKIRDGVEVPGCPLTVLTINRLRIDRVRVISVGESGMESG